MATQPALNRRDFLQQSALGSLILSTVLVGNSCRPGTGPGPSDPNQQGSFGHGVASFDPTDAQVILWTRVTPANTAATKVTLTYQLATDSGFRTVVKTESIDALLADDFTVSIDLSGLTANTAYFYQFTITGTNITTAVGETRTLPRGTERTDVKIAFCSCSNYPAGLFNVYGAIAASDADVVLHLGDYIYEYGAGQYGNNSSTGTLNRAHLPATEILSLDDYRTRFKQYRTDPQLQLAHQKKPFICVWDDHEVANNAWRDGAQNHQANEGPYATRKAAALKAYHEYIGIRTTTDERIYRSFTFGNILNLHMLDTRLVGRDQQLDYSTYLTNGQLNSAAFQRDWQNPARTMLGSEQRTWLANAISSGTAAWQVLGQQVQMTKMYLPAELTTNVAQLLAESAATGGPSQATISRTLAQITELTALKDRAQRNDPTLTAAERARITNQLPYNLDAWDGYPAEREAIYGSLRGKRFMVLAGDTHNGWYADLTATSGSIVGREIAAPSVTSPGFESILGANVALAPILEQALTLLIDDLTYANISQRGYCYVTYTTTRAVAEWRYVGSIATQTTSTTTGRTETIAA
jgi:alkaline phosphatase D